MKEWLASLKLLSLQEAFLLFLFENLLVMLLAVGFGHLLIWLCRPDQTLGPRTEGISRKELRLASLTWGINTGITLAGYWLWKEGYIRMPEDFSWRVLPDLVVIFLAMDFLMYGLHWFIHKTFLYRWIHRLHHHYPDPKPIDLFVLHPVETVGFGSLWLLVIWVYPATCWAVFGYLALNVISGTVGHAGVEPVPAGWQRHFLLRYMGTSSFHFNHHQQEGYNFGFYTTIWDDLFGTRLREEGRSR